MRNLFSEQVCIRHYLNSLISKIAEANTSDDLLKIIEKTLPNAILLDIDSPSLSGLKLARNILQLYPNIRLIMLTTKPNNEELF